MQPKALTLAELAELTGSQLIGDPHHLIYGVADLESATSGEVSFFANAKYQQQMLNSKAGAIFISEEVSHKRDTNLLVSPSPSRAFQTAVEAFDNPEAHRSGFAGIHPTAVVHESARLGTWVTIGPHAVIDHSVSIGDRSIIGPGVYVGPCSTVGDDCTIYANVVIRENCQIGHRVTLQPGVVLGSCGFGYTTDEKGHHTILKQVGRVIVEDDVDIGANTTIDRARFQSTRIGVGTKIDNLVQVGHGVRIGPHCMIVAQTGIAGSSELGRHVILAGQAGVNGHIKVGNGVIVAGKGGVTKSIEKSGKYAGNPAIPIHEYNRNAVFQRRAEAYGKLVEQLEKKVLALEAKLEEMASV